MEQDRGDKGKFAAKGDQIRQVRTIRLTDKTWGLLGEKADDQDMSRADYLEALFAGDVELEVEESEQSKATELDFDIDEITAILLEALKLKANAGGKIKAKIKECLELMGIELEDTE